MKAPSRKTITAGIFFGFFILFFGALFFYFGQGFFTQSDPNFVDTDESRGFTFFPFGRGGSEGTGGQVDPVDTTNGGTDTTNPNEPGEVVEPEIERLRLVSDVPTAGGFVYRRTIENNSFFNVTPETISVMRYIERESGNVYETTELTRINSRVTNTTIPRVLEAMFVDGDSLLVRYIDPISNTLKTFSAAVSQVPETSLVDNEGAGLSRLSGVFLPDGIQDVSINNAGEILYTQTSPSGLVAIVTDALGQNKKQIFSSPLSEWKPDWAKRSETITMTQYPSSVAFGFSQILNRTTERTSPFISGVRALDVLLSPDGTRALVSYKDGNTQSLFIRNQDGTYSDTNLSTFAQKCVWSSDSVLAYCAEPINQISSEAPDLWYQGVESYSDDVWRINTNDATTRVLFSPFEENFYSLDIIDLDISADERFLFFRDKDNEYFWTYQLEL